MPGTRAGNEAQNAKASKVTTVNMLCAREILAMR